MDRVKSLFSASLWCAKASTISKRLNKHFFKGYLDVSHLGGGVGAFNINTWIKVGRLPSLLPEHQDLWLHLGLCIPHSFSAGGHPQEPTFLQLDCMCWGLQAAGWSWPMKTHYFWGCTQLRASVTRLQWQNGAPSVLYSGALPQGSQMLFVITKVCRTDSKFTIKAFFGYTHCQHWC